jgi:hypothetical protein
MVPLHCLLPKACVQKKSMCTEKKLEVIILGVFLPHIITYTEKRKRAVHTVGVCIEK